MLLTSSFKKGSLKILEIKNNFVILWHSLYFAYIKMKHF
jgi:hypothetical protein